MATFALKTAADLREKLRRDYGKLQATPLDSDATFNFFVTAEHMLDWVYPGKPNKPKRTAERNSSVVLQVCSHLANGAKHFTAEAGHHTSVKSTEASGGYWGGAYWGSYWGGAYWGKGSLIVTLEGDAEKEFGPSITAIDLAGKVMAFWDAHPLT